FGKENPLNKIIYLNDSIPLTVTGVLEGLPRNTHFHFDMLVSTTGIDAMDLTGWENPSWAYCYARLTNGADAIRLENDVNKQGEKIYGKCQRCPAESKTSLFIQTLREAVFSNLEANTLRSRSEYLLIM